MKKKVLLLTLSSLLACGVAVGSLVAISNQGTFNAEGTDDYWSIEVQPGDLTTSATYVSGTKVLKTHENENDVTFKFNQVKWREFNETQYMDVHYNDGEPENPGYICNTSEIRSMLSLTITLQNSFVLEWGWEVDGLGNPIYLDSTSISGNNIPYTFDFGGGKPNYFKLSGGDSGQPVFGAFTIKMDKSCEHGTSKSFDINNIRYSKRNDHYAVTGFVTNPSELTDVSLEEMVDGLPVTEIVSSAFRDKTMLRSINLDKIETVGSYAFHWCPNLTGIGSVEKIKNIGYSAFNTSGVTGDLVFGDDLICIDDLAFYGNPINSVTFSDNCDDPTIQDSAFRANAELTSFHIGSRMGYYFECDFYDMPKLATITIGAGNTYHELVNGVLIRNVNTLVHMPNNNTITSWVMPNTVTNCYDAFAEGHQYIESFTTNEDISWLSNYGFKDATALETVVLGGDINTLGYSLFQGCTSLTTVTFNPANPGNTYLDLRDSIFKGCTSLASITLPARTSYIGADLFKGCTSLATLGFEGTKDEWTAIEKGENWKDGIIATQVNCSDGALDL